MGLFKAATQAIGSTFGDQFLTGIRCDDMGNDILMKKITDENGTLAKGSAIIVAPGQMAVIYDNGKVLDATAEPGIYKFDSSSTPSFFGGDFGAVFKEMWTRFKFGGATAKEQAIYYFNTKEIIGNKFGTPNPVPYKDWGHPLLNARMGGYTPMRLDIKCFGTYTFKISDPAVFMERIGGTATVYKKDQLVEQMRSEVVGAFSNILNSLSEDEYKIEALSLPNKTDEIRNIMAKEEIDSCIKSRGIQLLAFVVESVTLTDESKMKIDEYELAGDQYQQQGKLTNAYANAIEAAAGNSNGAATGFMGIGMMNMASGNTFGNVTSNIANNVQYSNPSNQAAPQTNMSPVQEKTEETSLKETTDNNSTLVENDVWECSCGKKCVGKFCSNCGNQKPIPITECPNCKAKVTSNDKFCNQCGQKLQ